MLYRTKQLLTKYITRNLGFSTPKNAKITLFEPYNAMGQNLALLLKQSPHVSELRMYTDESSDKGVCMDLSHIDTPATIIPCNGPKSVFKALHGTDVAVVIGGNLPSKKYPTAKELYEANKPIIKSIFDAITSFETIPLIVFAIEPLGYTLRHAKDILKNESSYDFRRVLGAFTVASTRINTLASQHVGSDPEKINTQVCFGSFPSSYYPLIETSPLIDSDECNRRATFSKRIMKTHNEAYNLLIANGGSEGPYMTYAHALYYYVNSVCYAIDTDSLVTLSSMVNFPEDLPEYSREGFYSVYPCVIGKNGLIERNRAYKQYDNFFLKESRSARDEHRNFEIDRNKVDPEEILTRTK